MGDPEPPLCTPECVTRDEGIAVVSEEVVKLLRPAAVCELGVYLGKQPPRVVGGSPLVVNLHGQCLGE